MLKSRLLTLLAISLLLVTSSAAAVIKVSVFHRVETARGVEWIVISIKPSAWLAHFAHGDRLVICPGACDGGD